MGQSQGYYQGQYGGSSNPANDMATGAMSAASGMATGAMNAVSGMATGAMNAGQTTGNRQMGGRGFGFMTRRKHRKMRKSRKSHKKRSHRRR
jgi:hypothetical protein